MSEWKSYPSFRVLSFPVMLGEMVGVYPLYYNASKKVQSQPVWQLIKVPACLLDSYNRSRNYTDISKFDLRREKQSTTNQRYRFSKIFVDVGLMNLIAHNQQRIRYDQCTHVSYNHQTFQVQWLRIVDERLLTSQFPPLADQVYFFREISRMKAERLCKNNEVYNYAKLKHNLKFIYQQENSVEKVLTWCRGGYRDDRNFQALVLNFQSQADSATCYQLRDALGNKLTFSEENTYIHYCPFGKKMIRWAYFLLLVHDYKAEQNNAMKAYFIDISNLTCDDQYLVVHDYNTFVRNRQSKEHNPKDEIKLIDRKNVVTCMNYNRASECYQIYVMGGEEPGHAYIKDDVLDYVEILKIGLDEKKSFSITKIEKEIAGKKYLYRGLKWKYDQGIVVQALPAQRKKQKTEQNTTAEEQVEYGIQFIWSKISSRPPKGSSQKFSSKDMIKHYATDHFVDTKKQEKKSIVVNSNLIKRLGERVGVRAHIALIPPEACSKENYPFEGEQKPLYWVTGGTNDLASDNREAEWNSYPYSVITNLEKYIELEQPYSRIINPIIFESSNRMYASVPDYNAVTFLDSDKNCIIRQFIPERYTDEKFRADRGGYKREEWVYVLELLIPNPNNEKYKESIADFGEKNKQYSGRLTWQVTQHRIAAAFADSSDI